MNTLSLGRYIPYDSLVHRMDPRCKILALVAFIVAIFMPMKNWAMTFTMEGIALVVFSTILISSHMKITQILSNLKSLWIMVIFLLIIFVITPRANPTVGIAFYIGNYAIWWDSFLEAGRVILRLALMIEITTTLTATTKPLD
ncbi:MAG: hypothetical protein K5694_03355, partial [Bacilli bacterium]|nr:hypothetical protein [Bacilli bacterium]